MLIYLATNTINGKQYVGCTEKTFEIRKRQHILCALTTNKDEQYFHAAIKKHGEDAFKWEVLEEGIGSRCLLNEREKYWVNQLSTHIPNGYNLTFGGDGASGYKHRPESVEKMRRASLGNKKRLGIPQSDFNKERTRQANLGNTYNVGRPRSEATKEKLRQARKSYVVSDETRRKLSESHKGQIPWNKGVVNG